MKYLNKLFLILIFALFVADANAQNIAREYKPGASVQAEKKAKPAKEKPHHVGSVDYNAPTTDQNVIDISQLGEDVSVNEDCESVGNVCLTLYTARDKVIVIAENRNVAVRTLNIKYFLNNMKLSQNSEGANIVLLPGEKKKIETIYVTDPNYNFTYNYSYTSYFGVIDAIHDDGYKYDLPFEAGEKHLIWQGVGGKFSHSDDANYYAYDFKMPIGTPVLAARDGKVVDTIDEFTKGGIDKTLTYKKNYVYVQHSDGTIANYSHLQYKGALVHIGDTVQKGQKIALSGNTGYTTNPHLHFGVFKVTRGGKYKAVPIKLKTSDGVKSQLKSGEMYGK